MHIQQQQPKIKNKKKNPHEGSGQINDRLNFLYVNGI